MLNPSATPTPVTPPRVPLIDPRTGLIDRAWYMFFVSLVNAATLVYDGDVGPSPESLIASYDAALQALAQNVDTQPLPVDLSAELTKQIEAAGLADYASGLLSQIAEMQKQLDALNLLPPSAQLAEMQKQIDALDLLPPPSQGTVVAVTATAPVASSGGIAPDISLNAAYGDTLNPYAAKTANFVLAGPASGAAAAPAFRALVAADVPTLPYVTSVSGTAGRITSTGGTTPIIDLASGVATPGTTGSSTQVPVITIDTYGRVTSITTAANPQGTVTSVAASVPSFLSVAGSPITTSGTLAISLSGTALPTTSGGTGLTSFTSGGVVYASSTSALATGSVFVFNGTNVGIGIASPAQKLHVKTTFASGVIQLGDTGTTGYYSQVNQAANSLQLIANGDQEYRVALGTNNGSGNIKFFTANATTGNTERMSISSTGIVTMNAYGAGTATFSAAGVISSVSDETWKTKDGVPVDPDAMLKKLAPGYWYYNEEKSASFGKERQLGFYAQNVNAAIGPEAAPEPEEGKPWGYYDRSVLAVVVMSLQNALDTIDSLTARLAALEQK